MSNEELVMLIQNGHTEKIVELWEAVRGFIAWRAKAYATVFDGRFGVEVDDLLQAGFLAVAAAVETFAADGDGKFITWLNYYIKAAFNQAAGLTTERRRKDPINCADSLHRPILDADEDMLLLDTIEGANPIEDVERRLYNEDLRRALDRVLAVIPAPEAEVLREHYFSERDLTDIAQDKGVSLAAVSARKRHGLQSMRNQTKTSRGVALREYLNDNISCYAGNGFARYANTMTSPVEFKVLQAERLEREFLCPDAVEEWTSPPHDGVWRAAQA